MARRKLTLVTAAVEPVQPVRLGVPLDILVLIIIYGVILAVALLGGHQRS